VDGFVFGELCEAGLPEEGIVPFRGFGCVAGGGWWTGCVVGSGNRVDIKVGGYGVGVVLLLGVLQLCLLLLLLQLLLKSRNNRRITRIDALDGPVEMEGV